MLRDTIKNEEYFANFLAEDNERINKFISNIEINSIPKDRIQNVLAKIFGISIGIIVADYSFGKNKEDIIKDYNRALHFLEMDWDKSAEYVALLWLLSIGILLDIENDTFNKLVKIIDTENYNDGIIDFLINGTTITDKILYKEPYRFLMEILNLPDNLKIEKLKIYLNEKWYKGHRDSYWYDNHKSKHNTYFGYWSFEVGAIIKKIKLNDSDLKKCKYYPYEMVHW
jgi:hypothetical protein